MRSKATSKEHPTRHRLWFGHKRPGKPDSAPRNTHTKFANIRLEPSRPAPRLFQSGCGFAFSGHRSVTKGISYFHPNTHGVFLFTGANERAKPPDFFLVGLCVLEHTRKVQRTEPDSEGDFAEEIFFSNN